MLVLCLTMFVTLADQWTKYLIRGHVVPGAMHPVIPGFLNLTYVRNTGAAWGMLGGFSSWLAALSVVVLFALFFFRRYLVGAMRMHRLSIGLLAGGVLGNLLDRVRLNYVVDFVDVYWRTHHFPAFNIADAAICCGVGLYVIAGFVAERAGQAADAVPPAEASAPPP